MAKVTTPLIAQERVILFCTATEVRLGANRNRRSDYFVIIRLGAALGVCSAGEITNVTQAFHPSGRFWLANSQ